MMVHFVWITVKLEDILASISDKVPKVAIFRVIENARCGVARNARQENETLENAGM